MNQKILIAVGVVVVLALGLWWMQSKKMGAPAENVQQTTATTPSEDTALDTVNIGGSVEADFEAADGDLKTL